MFHFLRASPHYLLPKKWLTGSLGALANVRQPHIKDTLIRAFISQYQVNMKEAEHENPSAYATFNDFFIRKLKKGLRPLAHEALISPVDGCVSEIGCIKEGQLLQAKGRHYSVLDLLAASPARCESFKTGHFATLYLSPKDYHRVHMPLDGTLTDMIYVPGKLFSVRPSTAQHITRLFARNERLVVFFDTAFGQMAMVLVGATIVGKIGTAWQGDIKRTRRIQSFHYDEPKCLKQGEEMGYFKLGSTVILLFESEAGLQWVSQLKAGVPIKMGEALGIHSL